jgi:SulP family sulfate permease
MNQQCLSEGVANLAGSFFQCFPGSGSLTRSTINQQAGAVSQWSGVISAFAVAVIVLALAPAARFIPRAALAGILMVSAFRMVDLRALRYHVRATYFDAAIVLGTAIAAVAISVEFCVLVGIFLSCMLTVPRAGRMRLTEFVVSPEGVVHERLPEDAPSPRLLIFGLEGELFFGAAAPLEEHFDAIGAKVGPETRVVLLRLKRAHNPDAVALTLLDGFLARMKARGVHVLLCGVRKHLHDVLQRTGTAARLDDPIFPEEPIRQTSTLKALEYARTLLDAPVSGLRSVARPVRSTSQG